MNPCSFGKPRRVLEKGVQDGYAWEVTVNPMLYRCGYVRIPKGHPWWGEDAFGSLATVECHWGLTYAGWGATYAGEPDHTEWWIGFDCAHADDKPDPELITLLDEKQQEAMKFYLQIIADRPAHLFRNDVIRSTEFARENCLHIITQAIQAAKLERDLLGWTPEAGR